MVRRRHSQWSCVCFLELFIKSLLTPGRFWPLVREITLLTGRKKIERFIETWLKGCTCEGRRIIFLLLQGNIFTEMNYCHENQSDLAKNLRTPLMIFSYSIKNKCSMASGSRWDDCDTGAAQGNAEKECEQVPQWGSVPGWTRAFTPPLFTPSCSRDVIFLQNSKSQSVHKRTVSCVLLDIYYGEKRKPNQTNKKNLTKQHFQQFTAPWSWLEDFSFTHSHQVWSCHTWGIH